MDELNEIEKQALETINAILARFPAVTQALKNFGDAAKRSSADFKKSIEDLNKDIKKGRAGFTDQLRMLENLNDALEDLGKQVKNSENIERKTQLEKQK